MAERRGHYLAVNLDCLSAEHWAGSMVDMMVANLVVSRVHSKAVWREQMLVPHWAAQRAAQMEPQWAEYWVLTWGSQWAERRAHLTAEWWVGCSAARKALTMAGCWVSRLADLMVQWKAATKEVTRAVKMAARLVGQ